MMARMKTCAIAAVLALLVPLAAAPPPRLPHQVKLGNERVRVTEITYLPGVPRDRSIRQHDQVIVFMDDCKYRRIDSGTGEETVRERKAGDVIWHNKGEDAPVLINLGDKPYRTMLIEILK